MIAKTRLVVRKTIGRETKAETTVALGPSTYRRRAFNGMTIGRRMVAHSRKTVLTDEYAVADAPKTMNSHQ
jgi:hypothetical protein